MFTMLCMEKSIEAMEKKTIEPIENSMNTLEIDETLGKSMNTMEKNSKTMERSMNSGHCKF